MDIRFTEVFFIEVRSNVYRDFIATIRGRVAGDAVSHGRPVLPPEETIPNHMFVIVLRTNEPHEIRLLFRRWDLYLLAYQMENSATWLEFSAQDQVDHLVPGSSFLGFDGGYTGAHNLEATAGLTRAQIELSRDALRGAVNRLAISTDMGVRARSLLVVIQMISEAMRFEDIRNFIFDNYEGVGSTPNVRLRELENSWGQISNNLLRSDAHPTLSLFPLRYMDFLNSQPFQAVFTAAQVMFSIGILKYNVDGIPDHLRRRHQRMTSPLRDGRPLVEVFAVGINHGADLYGTVTVTDGLVSQYLYNRERDNNQSIEQNNDALLTGPTAGSISALDSFTIDVALKNKHSFLFFSDDNNVSTGQIAWNVYHTRQVYDEPVRKEIYGDDGKNATVVYAVLSNAVQATVEITLIWRKPASVFGILAASNSMCTQNFESVLFRIKKDSGQSVQVEPRQIIPLSRSIVAVPLNSNLIISVDLHDRYSYGIANGIAKFPAQLSGTSQQNISNDNPMGSIQVTITWTP